jgi:carbamoyl-phosphate synthase large subunit
MASFEPTIDYCVVKIPRFTFEKFRARDFLTTSMKSVARPWPSAGPSRRPCRRVARTRDRVYGLSDTYDAPDCDARS